jgi:hypothetical protein
VATAIARFIEGSAATKADVERVEVALKAEIATVRAETARVEVALRSEITRVADRTFNRLGTPVAVVAGILFAALHMWPSH